MRTPHKAPIDWLLPRARQKVLALLMAGPEARWHLRDIGRRTQLAVGTVRRELQGLTDAGIVSRLQDGNRTLYQANRRSFLFPELSALMRKTAGLADVIRQALQPLSAGIAWAFVFGSQARGAASAGSDVDLMVIGDVEELSLHRALQNAEETLARPVNYTLLGRTEFKSRRAEKEGFLARVLKGHKLVIVGGANEV